MIKFGLLLMTLSILSTVSIAQDSSDEAQRSRIQNACDINALKSYNPISGTIPLSYGHMPSTDLVCDSDECGAGFKVGDVLSPKQASLYYQKRFNETRCQWTLADLNPKEEPSIWTNTIGAKTNPALDNLDVNTGDKVEFVSEGWARLGSYRVTVNKNNSYGTPLQYTLILAKNVHNYMLRRELLRKLGYVIPPIKHVKWLKIKFNKHSQKEDFVKNLSVNNAGSFDRWITSQKRKEVVLQDIVVMEDQEFRLNLAKGYLSADIFQGKRIYDSLIIPYALTNFLESINITDWTVGRVFSENIVFKYPESKIFSTSKDDAVWMVRRIMKLTEADWKEIVDATNLPSSVKMLIFEKLKSRRNHLGSLFKVDNENLSVNPLISNQEDLVEGKLVYIENDEGISNGFYDGFARRFSIPDPASPLAFSDMMAFFKSKAVTVGLELLMNTINSASFMGTDLSGKITEFYEQLSNNLAESMTEGSDGRLPVRAFAFPTVRGNLILNRDIVTGSYLGTDNLIQLVDTVGASVSGGVFGGITGVYARTGARVPVSATESIRQFMPVDVYGNATVFLNRTYSHVRPITSVQKALKYPFKNMMVPLLKNKYGHYFDSIMTAEYDKLSDAEKVQLNKSSYAKVEKALNQIAVKIRGFAKAIQTKEVLEELASVEENLKSIKAEYVSALEDTPVLANTSNLLKGFRGTFQKNYITTSNCREESKENINKYFSIVEKEIKEKDEDGNMVIVGTEDVICAVNKKGKIAKVIRVILSDLAAATNEASHQVYRLAKKQRAYEMEEITKLLDSNLEIGESLIVQDTIGGSLTASLGLDLYNVAQVRASVKPNKLIVNRLHIMRRSAEEFHVYKDFGNVQGVEIAMSVEKFVPIMKITFKKTKGRGKTEFFKVDISKYSRIVKDVDGNIDDNLSTKNPNRVDNLKGLRSAFLVGATSGLKQVKAPFTITHKFNEDNSKLGLLVYRWNWLKQEDKMIITSPEGYEKKVYRQTKGYTKGADYENYTRDLVDLIFSRITDTNFSISSFNEGNPGYSYMGKAQNRITSYEGILNDDGVVEKPYTKLSRIWNGWKMKKKKALKTLKEIKKKYGFKFFENEVLAQTKEIFLYNINVNFFVYDTGLKHMLTLPQAKIKKIWLHYQSRNMTHYTGSDALERSGYSQFMRYRKRYSKYLLENNQKKLARMAIKMVETVESKLRIAGMSQIFGGGNNFFAMAKIDGFRVGDENGDKKVLSNTFGRIGTEDIEGPLSQLRRFIGITKGEFEMSWLLGRVI